MGEYVSKWEHLDERYIDSLSAEQLRNELKYELNRKFAMREAFSELPEVPSPLVLNMLNDFAKFERDWDRGKRMQRDHDIPPNTECETGAGLWSIIRPALIAAENETGS